MKKRQPIQARCYRDDIPIGVMTLTEWEDVLDVEYNKIFRAYKNGGVTKTEDGAKLRFEPVGQDDDEYKMSLSEAEELARGEGKSYGQMQAEKYLQEHPIIPKKGPKEMEKQREQEEMEPMLENTVVEDLEDKPTVRGPLTLAEFLLYLDEDELLQLETIDRGGNATFIGIAPRFSPLLRNVGDMEIDSIETDYSDGKTVLHVYLSEETENP